MSQFAWMGITFAYLFGWVVCAREYALHHWNPMPPPGDWLVDSRIEALGNALIWPVTALTWLVWATGRLGVRLLMGDLKEPWDG